MIPPLLALLIWIPIALYWFWRFPPRIAILLNFVGGWAVLPTAAFAPTTAPFPYWILGTCLPSIHFVTKATVPGICCLAGILLFDHHSFRRFALTFWDLPMMVWCVVPLLSAVANAQSIAIAIGATLYQSLAWGVPYYFGRLYLNDTDALELAARSFVIAGLGYVPICVIEFFTGPQFYAFLYGYQPYRWVGATRYVGYRPIGLLEDGNQLGIWMAASTLIAIWLWRRTLVNTVLRIPIAWVSAALLVTTLLCQSAGSIVLLLCLLPFVFIRTSFLPRTIMALVLLAIVGLIGLRLANTVSLQSLVKQNVSAQQTARFLRGIHRNSFGWRLSQDEKHVSVALETPLLGSGAWDWWKASDSRPWGLWLLAFGMYGIAGLLALQCLQLLPVARAIGFSPAGARLDELALRSALAAAVLMSAIDNLLNGCMILPLVLLIGGLSTPMMLDSESRKGEVWPAHSVALAERR